MNTIREIGENINTTSKVLLAHMGYDESRCENCKNFRKEENMDIGIGEKPDRCVLNPAFDISVSKNGHCRHFR